LNGGLGTSMGCSGPKSLIQISEDGCCFLDYIIQSFNLNSNAADLIFLNSFNTSSQTKDFLATHYSDLDWHELYQHSFKKVCANSLTPLANDSHTAYNPPGHGSVFYDLYHSGLLSSLLDKGVDYIFISNADNLAASLDNKIISYLSASECPFLIELTPKTSADVKGGTLINYDGNLKLWEIAQVADDQHDMFMNQPYFNTNNIWVSVSGLKTVIESNQLRLDLIQNKKSARDGAFIQMEYAMGSAIQSFPGAMGMIVPRTRFFPVKRTSDLLLLMSDFCTWNSSGQLVWDETRQPSISLGEPFNNIDDFFRLFSVIPSIKNTSSISLTGEVLFDIPVTFDGDVVITNQSSQIKSIQSYF
ncbi:MAG: UTP--glucose-1-phosphate uridylyltransferase, partial [Candidatus Margulisiibacteriota bacterium]|nr:UTP--glucose-1-phosphate uridylyltransferase [Candidatus Margulisiibacteriota bacterium]